MELSDFLSIMGQLPEHIREGDAFLKIKALIWTEVLESIQGEIDEEERLLSHLQTELLTAQRNKKKCMKELLQLSSAVQEGDKHAADSLERKKLEVEQLNEQIDTLEYERDLFPAKIRRIEERFFKAMIEELYQKLSNDLELQKSTVNEIDALRQIIKEKWTQKFELDGQILSLNTFISSVLNIDQMNLLDGIYLKGGSK